MHISLARAAGGGTLVVVQDLVVSDELAGTRDGLTQLQRRWRPADGRIRAAVVVVHGIGEHSGRYDHVGRFLASRGYDVLSFDNRGHGQTGGPRGYVERFEQFLDDVEDHVVERRQLGLPVVLIGHSLGGLISAAYVAGGRPAPDLLVLSAPALSARVPAWQKVAAPVLSRMAPRLFVPAGIDGRRLSRDPAVQAAYRNDPLRVRGATARLGHEVFTAMGRTGAALDRITLPTYVLHGSSDQVVPLAASAPLHGRANVTYRLWPELRHECFNEPEGPEVMAEMETWMAARLAEVTDPGSRR